MAVDQIVEPYKHTSNQLINQFVYNKSFIDLFNNDLHLQELFDSIYNSEQKGIQAYNPNATYSKGELVWFKADNYKGEPTLYLLESALNDNRNTPTLSYNGEVYTFQKSGWNDKNQYNTFLNADVKDYVYSIFSKTIDTIHSYDTSYHKFGKIANETDISQKVMKNDVLNADDKRSQIFYPCETIPLEEDNSIIGGQCRKWDNGLLEYDILFQLGKTGETLYYNNTMYDTIKCNNLKIDAESDSAKYFMSEDGYKMFNTECQCSVLLEGIAQVNKSGFCDSYSATLNFPIPFADKNYMIFGSGTRSVERDTGKQTIDCNLNAMSYINRTEKSIDAVYVLAPSKNVKRGSQNGLVSNCFHCQIVGKWK